MGVFLDVKEVTTGYGEREALRGASIRTLEPNTMTGLFGPNAADKSALMTVLAGIRKLMSGEIVLTRDSERVIGSKLRDVVGYMPQGLPTNVSLTAFESVLVSGRHAGRLRVRGSEIEHTATALRKVGIEHLADRFVGELSGDQRQLVAVAQMFARDPEIMLLDKPTSAFDLRHQVELLQLVHAEVISRSSLALVAIHDLSLAAHYCDELIIFHGGHAVAQGSPADILTPGLLARVYGIRVRVLDDESVPVVCPIEEDQVSEATQLGPQ